MVWNFVGVYMIILMFKNISLGDKFRTFARPKNMLCLYTFSLEFSKITNLLMTIEMINRKCSLMAFLVSILPYLLLFLL